MSWRDRAVPVGRGLLDAMSDETADDRAAQGWQQIIDSKPVQDALDWRGNLKRQGETMRKAAHGDRDAQLEVAQNSLGIAMGALDAPAKLGKAAKGAKKAADAALDMSHAARMKRAQDMGFDTERVWYHGTKGDIPEFDKSFTGLSTNADSAKKGFFFSSTPQTASGYAETAMPSRAAKEHAKSNALLDDLLKYQETLKAKYGPKWQRTSLATDAEMDVLDQKLKAFKDHAAIRDQAGGGVGAVVPDETPELQALKAKVDAFANSPNYPGKWTSKEADEAHAASVKYNALYDDLMQKATESARVQEAAVLPVHARSKNPLIHDFKGEAYRDVTYSELIDKARAGGHDSLILKNTYDPAYKDVVSPTPEDILVVLDPSQIRSKFADFNPKKAKSGNLSAAVAGIGLGAGALAAGGGEAQAAEGRTMGGWRDRAVPATGGGWRSRALPDQPQETPSGIDPQAALEGFGQGVSMGYLPHLQAAAAQLVPDPNADLDAKLRAEGFDVQGAPTGYLAERDANLARHESLKEESPGSYYGGQVGGLVASAPAIAKLLPAAAEGAGLLAKVGKGALAGGIQGAVMNPGDVAGEISPLQLGERARNAGVGGLIGGAATGLLEGAGAIKGWLRDKAAKKAMRAVGRPTPSQATQMAESGKDIEIGRMLLDEGAIPRLGTPGRIQGRVEALRNKNWKGVEDLLSMGGDEALVDGTEVGIGLLEHPDLAILRKTPGAESTVAAIEKAADTISGAGKMTLQEAQAIKRSIDKQINYNKAIPDMTGSQEARFMSRTGLRDQMDEVVGGLGAGKGALKAAFKKQGLLEQAADIAEREAGRQQANHAVSIRDLLAGGAGAGFGGPIGALATAAASKAGRTFGNSLQARGYDALAKGAGLIPAGAAPAVSNFAERAAMPPEYAPEPVVPVVNIFRRPTGGR